MLPPDASPNQVATASASVGPVLACVAATPRGALVAQAARGWADLLVAELRLLHVAPDAASADVARRADWLPADLRDRLEVAVEAGRVDRLVCRRAAASSAQLVILGALGQDGVWTSLLGSVARRVAREAPCSVLLLPDPARPMLGRVVVSLGFDDQSTALLRSVLRLVRRSRPERLDVLHEIESFGDLTRTLGNNPECEVREHRDSKREALRERVAALAGAEGITDLPLRIECLEGHVGQAATDYASQTEADLLVMTAPPRLSLWDRFFKQPAELALHQLPCSLLLHRLPLAGPPPKGDA
jgi:nucleotide-binding universal stress UspA family protein